MLHFLKHLLFSHAVGRVGQLSVLTPGSEHRREAKPPVALETDAGVGRHHRNSNNEKKITGLTLIMSKFELVAKLLPPSFNPWGDLRVKHQRVNRELM